MTAGLVALAQPLEEGAVSIASPAVGYVVGLPAPGVVLVGGQRFAEFELLGGREPLRLPASASGRVVFVAGDGARRFGAAYGEPLLRLEPVGDVLAREASAAAESTTEGALVLRAPMTGRFYVRPAPDKPAFVKQGDVLEAGRTIGLLEVMKTFSRVLYEGADLPTRARVLRVVPADGDDVEEGESLLELEAVD
ncbi:MAG: hypothetical protein GXP55_11650 [Deltaproteobacteria bacterium]|nr:hypothetical protein [Deltaproteobacteria bacterium]